MADDSNTVIAEGRDQFGKGAARRIRAVGKIPAVLYGHGTDPVHVTLPAHQIGLILRKANAVIDLDIAGKHHTALVKDVQKDPVRQIIEHIDLIVVRKGERVRVDVAVHIAGEPAAGTVVDLDAKSLLLEAPATNIPENLVADVTDLEAGTHILAGDIPLPEGAVLLSEPETLVVAISVPTVQDLGEEPESAEEEAVEGEGGPEGDAAKAPEAESE